MNLEHSAIASMKPGYDDDFVADSKPIQSGQHVFFQFKPNIGSTLGTLLRSASAALDSGSNNPEGTNCESSFFRFQMSALS